MTLRPRFPLGQTIITPRALGELTHEEVIAALGSHVSGEWGEVPPTVVDANESAIDFNEPVISAYSSPSAGKRFFVVTTADRSQTAVFLNGEMGEPAERM
jgi:hypothetical protein